MHAKDIHILDLAQQSMPRALRLLPGSCQRINCHCLCLHQPMYAHTNQASLTKPLPGLAQQSTPLALQLLPSSCCKLFMYAMLPVRGC